MSNDKAEPIETFVSLVWTLRNAEPIIEERLRAASAILAEHFTDYEILLIDRMSTDGTISTVDRLLGEIPSIRLIELTQPTKPDIARSAGLENAIAEFVIIADIDSDPVDIIPELVRLCREGSDIVIGVSPTGLTTTYRLVQPILSRLLKYFVGYSEPRWATTLRCLSRQCVNSVTQTKRFHQRFFVQIARTRYPTTTLTYEVASTGRTHARRVRPAVRDTIHALVFNSTSPLRWISAVGILGSGLAFFAALYSLLINVLRDQIVEGWTSLMLLVSILFSLLFLMLAFFGEYLGRLLNDQGDHEIYDVVTEKHSSVMLDESRINVIEEHS